MTSTLVLAAPDFSKPFILECNASGTGVGAMHMQDKHAIALESQKLKPSEKTKSAYEKETLVIIHSLVKWKQYLLGEKFLFKLDHNNLNYFLTHENLC